MDEENNGVEKTQGQMDRADEIVERRNRVCEREEAILERKETLAAREKISGNAEGGQAKEEKESNADYANDVMEGKYNGKKED